MKRISYLILTTLACFVFASCIDDAIVDSKTTASPFDESDLIEAKLSVEVSAYVVSVNGTRAGDNPDHEEPTDDEETMSDFERQIDNIWVFQYDTDGNLLIKPRYYTATQSLNSDGLWNVVLKPEESTVYIVTNVNSTSWTENYENFMTIEGLKEQSLPFPQPITDVTDDATTGHIPMQGRVDNVCPEGTDEIEVEVEHMYAKVKMRVLIDNDLDNYYAYINNVLFSNIPWYCRIVTLYDKTAASKDADYPQSTNTKTSYWITRSFTDANNINDPYNDQFEEGFTYDYVIYIPENIQGEVSDKTTEDKDDKETNAPEHACTMSVGIGYIEGGIQESTVYTVYPGGNEWNNYNIRRNQVYRVTVEIGYPINPDNSPSANCIVGHPGTTITFEPYYRVERGGGYDYNDYVDCNDPSKTIKGLRILWQTEECIGDNSHSDKVWLSYNEQEPIYSKIYVTVNKPGNAVIAAYADEDCEGDILWSWHIWVTDEDPTNIGNAIVYYTYDWDETQIYGIYTDRARVPGYGCMPCNLGALASEPTAETGEGAVITYGMLYQWGRKDPFPALKGAASGKYGNSYKYTEFGAYTQNTTEHLWDNDYNRITGMTDDTYTDSLFHSVTAQDILNGNLDVAFSIKNPTVFMCGTQDAAKRSSDYVAGQNSEKSYGAGKDNYPSELGGDWHVNSDEKLWGATEVTNDTKCLVIGKDRSGDYAHLYDDYGEKSIFDPCPYGWRVSPPDQWLAYTDDGGNPSSTDGTTKINYKEAYGYGMYMYIQNWKEGLTSYFPTQGTRAPDGSGGRPLRCGNYHNATADAGVMQRVNILHIHDGYDFNIFELGILAYYVKSVAGPVRCVRDTR